MENFTIKTRLTSKEYVKVMYVGLYKKPAFILATLIGVYLLMTVVLGYLKSVEYFTETPWFEIICGTFLLAAPTLIVFLAFRQFTSNASFKNDITFTFGDSGISINGATFKSEFLWTHIVKQKELGKFLILYHDKKFGNFIDKSRLTSDQLKFIKSKVGQK